MPTSANVTLPLLPPRLHISAPIDGDSDKKLRHKEQGRTSNPEWIDIDEDKPRRRRKAKRTPPASEALRRQSKPSEKSSTGNDLGRFFPKLSQILEISEPKSQPRQRQSDQARTYTRNESIPQQRRAVRSRESSLHRQQESLLHFNASLLSVISGLTSSTDRSGGSNSTITQRSYTHRGDASPRRHHKSYRRAMSDTSSVMRSPTRSQISYQYDDEQDEEPQCAGSSSPASQHQSDPGSSDAPGTSSSRSTFPSPGFSRKGSHDLPRSYEHRTPSPVDSTVAASEITQSDVSEQSASMYDEASVVDDDDDQYFGAPMPPHAVYEHDPQQIPSQAQSAYERMQAQAAYDHSQQPLLAPMPAHPSAFSAQYLEDMHRSHSQSSSGSALPQQALQHYFTRPDVANPLSLIENNNKKTTVDARPPPAPEAPSLDQRTLAGYEKLALELSSSASPVRPMYRKFEFLNHRLLLHLQDELAELEEQLRRTDEIIAQMEPGDGERSPASRRGEAYYGVDIHHHRTALLGRIFMKTEQYNKAMSLYSAMVRDSTPASTVDVASYRLWMAKETPVHEVEARFLANAEDLVMPGRSSVNKNTSHLPTALFSASVVLLLPPALFALIPTLLGRLVVTFLIAVTVIILRTTTRILHGLSFWDTMTCASAFLLLMSTVAFLVPQHTV